MTTHKTPMEENPYERVKEIEETLSVLGNQEKQLKSFISRGMDRRSNEQRLSENTSEQFYLILENECLKKCIKWFEVYYLGYLKAKEVENENNKGD